MWLAGLRAEQAWGGDIQHGARGELVNFERMPSKCRGTVPGSRTWQISFARSGCPFRLTVRSHGYAYQAIRDYRPYRRFVIEIRVTVGYGAGGLPLWLPRLRLASMIRPGGVCFRAVSCLSGGTSEVGGDDVSGVPVEAAAGTVVSHSCPGISMRGGFLHVAERDPRVEGGGDDERMPQRVRPDWLGDPSAAGD